MPGADLVPRRAAELRRAPASARDERRGAGRDRRALADARARSSSPSASCREQVARARAGLQRLGVGPGDRVVAYLPNIPETLVAFAATASLGAVWASCAPELGPRSVVDRLVPARADGAARRSAATASATGSVDRRDEVATIRAALPTLRHVVARPVRRARRPGRGLVGRAARRARAARVRPGRRSTIRCSCSSRRGRPAGRRRSCTATAASCSSCSKAHAFSWDLKPGGRLLWFTTTSWMMWNALVAALLVRASIVMLDGDPGWPDLGWQWRVAEETRATFMGVSPAFLMACRKAGLEPGPRVRPRLDPHRSARPARRSRRRAIASVYEQLGPDVLLINGSGGTDVCSGIVGGSPLLPVYEGEISGPPARRRRRGVRPRRPSRSSASWASS